MFMFLVLFVTFCKVDFRRLRPVAWHWWLGAFQLLGVGVPASAGNCSFTRAIFSATVCRAR